MGVKEARSVAPVLGANHRSQPRRAGRQSSRRRDRPEVLAGSTDRLRGANRLTSNLAAAFCGAIAYIRYCPAMPGLRESECGQRTWETSGKVSGSTRPVGVHQGATGPMGGTERPVQIAQAPQLLAVSGPRGRPESSSGSQLGVSARPSADETEDRSYLGQVGR